MLISVLTLATTANRKTDPEILKNDRSLSAVLPTIFAAMYLELLLFFLGA